MRTFLWQARGRENRGQLLKLPVQMKLLETTLLAATGNNSIYLIDPGGTSSPICGWTPPIAVIEDLDRSQCRIVIG